MAEGWQWTGSCTQHELWQQACLQMLQWQASVDSCRTGGLPSLLAATWVSALPTQDE